MSTDWRWEEREWKEVVGAGILAFGDLELLTFTLLETIPRDRIYASFANATFARRVDVLQEIVAARRNHRDSFDKLSNILARAKRLAEVRNLIAHNPLAFNVHKYQDPDDEHGVSGMIIRHPRIEGKYIDLPELKEFVAEVETLVSELTSVALLLRAANHLSEEDDNSF